jgi:hypothetical protein
VIKDLFAAFAVALGLTAFVFWQLELPVVQYRHQTGECVAVIPPSAGSCKNLPQRHEAEWVAPR